MEQTMTMNDISTCNFIVLYSHRPSHRIRELPVCTLAGWPVPVTSSRSGHECPPPAAVCICDRGSRLQWSASLGVADV